ncbi:hypothetical protein GJ496_003765 [Pomphorhynchus laevis]|nr:hypothetical protein GJ496_003765 [Pomphorhynchus laevis]
MRRYNHEKSSRQPNTRELESSSELLVIPLFNQQWIDWWPQSIDFLLDKSLWGIEKRRNFIVFGFHFDASEAKRRRDSNKMCRNINYQQRILRFLSHSCFKISNFCFQKCDQFSTRATGYEEIQQTISKRRVKSISFK